MSLTELLNWIMSAAGIGVVSNYVTAFAKSKLGWENSKARLLSGVVSLLVGTLAFFALKYQWYQYAEEFWPIFVIWFMATFGSWGVSQINYTNMPKKEQ